MFMKKAKIILAVAFVCLSLAMVCGQAQAGRSALNEVLTMDAGESTIREFVIYDQLDPGKLGPIEAYLVIGTGDNTTKMGDLTITLKPTATKTFGSELDYCLLGLIYPVGSAPVFINVKTAAPLSITKTVKMNAIYGFALVGAYIKNIKGDVNLPVPFAITFSWAAK
jgi:hypothetical protein